MNQIKIPSHWSWRTVRELGTSGKPTVKAGPFGSALKKEFYVDSGFRVYGQEQVIAGDLSIGNYYISPDKFRTLRSCEVAAGDILVSLVGSFGKILVVPDIFEPGIINPRLVRLSLDPEVIIPSFFSYFFRSPSAVSQMELKSHGGTMGIINAKNIADLFVPLPPIDQQKRIAAILDKAEELRRLRRQSIEHLDVLSQSIFIEMFGDPVTNPKGWNRVIFSDLLLKIESGHSPNCLDRPVIEDKEWGVLKLGAITSCKYNPLENKALPPNEKPHLELEVKVGDLLFTRKNTYELVAACALVLTTIPNLLLPDLIFRFRLKLDAPMNSSFLHQLLINPAKRREIQKLASGSSSSMPNISKAKLQSTLIEVPPLSLQQEFAQRIESIESLKAKHRESLAHLDTLFTSLQHRAFRGEL